MASPSLESTYPANGDTGIPVGITIKLYFDYGVDLESVKNSLALYGSDFDMTSGPESAIWVDNDTGDNPFFLSSPGFKGLIPLKIELQYYNLGSSPGEEVSPILTSQDDETSQSVGHLVKITLNPKYNSVLAANTLYTLLITGDPDNQNTGISRRTVFDSIGADSNSSAGEPVFYGTWQGSNADAIRVKITSAGNIGVMEYKWWYVSLGEASATTRVVSNRRFRTLADGLQIRFTGSNFVVGDTWDTNVFETQRLAASTKIQFTTNDGSYTNPPESTSTPATSVAPSTVLPSEVDPFEVINMDPSNGSYNVPKHKRTITITFSEEVDPSSITSESVQLWKYPVDGVYGDTWSPVKLQTILSVDGSILTIKY